MDVEQDFPSKIKNGYVGIEHLQRFLLLLRQLDLDASFFITADVCNRFPETVRQIHSDGHLIGCHGYCHRELWFKTYRQQLDEIERATLVLSEVLGFRPSMFRAPRFSVNERTLKALEKLDYSMDSSILPNHEVRCFKGLIKCHSHKGAPVSPYHPSLKDIKVKGSSSLIEVPLTENPLFAGAPIGAGFLNKYGVDETLKAISLVQNDYVMFLLHPWELIDIGQYYPYLEDWILEICSGDLSILEQFFEAIKKEHIVCNFKDIMQNI